jgi:tetratricopeptide (TPR) repeat protein
MSHRRSVMISSTARDLPTHREQARLACERAGFAPHDMMEHLTALNADAVAASLAMVESADIYIGIFAYRYGYLPNGSDKSITELEYDRAVELDKPRLIFFAHEDHPFTVKDVETGAGAVKLQALKDRIGKARVAAFFRSPEDLRANVVEALNAFAKGIQEGSAETASSQAVAQLHRRTFIPEAPVPYVAHPYTLLQTRELVGRRAELNLLTDWVSDPKAATGNASVLAIIAIGGMGKSAHAWTWFNQIAPNEMKSLAGRLWWSFYESDATFDNFLNRALCYVSGERESDLRERTWQDREGLLLQYFNEKPFLVVLDGMERILIAYGRMDANALADDEYDQQTANYVTGAAGLPESAAQSFVGQHRLRETLDPRAGAFLQKLALVRRSRFLITSRLYPSALQLPAGGPRPGCAAHFLHGLNDDDALTLWRSLGVSGSRGELVPIFNSVRNHPMLVQALASEVANHRKAPGNFALWRADHPQFDPSTLTLVQSRTHILQFALQGLAAEHREVLHTIVGFRMPASYGALEALLVGSGKLFLNVEPLDRALTDLEDRGLIGWDREANRYDAHPIVRSVVWELADVDDKRAVMTTLEQHFQSITIPDWESVNSLPDLTAAVERYHTLVELGRYEDAYALFYDRLDDATLYRLSAHNERISWLERLIPNGSVEEALVSNENTKASLISSLALSYSVSGQPSKSVKLLEQCINHEIAEGDARSYSINLCNLGVILDDVGSLAKASIAFSTSLISSRDDEDHLQEAISLRELGRHKYILSNGHEATEALMRSSKILEPYGQQQTTGLLYAYVAEYYLLLCDYHSARLYANRAWQLASIRKFEMDFIQFALLQGRSELGLNNILVANERLHHALARARASNVVEFELPILVALAELKLKQADLQASKGHLDEAWDGLERGPFRLVQADAFNVLAEAELAAGNRAAAVEAASNAFRASWCDGAPFGYGFGLAKARALLGALHAPEPELPPFDPSHFEPIPPVEINLKDEHWVDLGNISWN